MLGWLARACLGGWRSPYDSAPAALLIQRWSGLREEETHIPQLVVRIQPRVGLMGFSPDLSPPSDLSLSSPDFPLPLRVLALRVPVFLP
jgi:hypothetical protein